MPPSRLPPRDADALGACNICSFVSEDQRRASPTRGTCVPFTVIQDKGKSKQRRFILWTRSHNSACRKAGYEPYLPDLQHISNFLPDIHHEAATLRDMRLSFWQVPIPEAARPLFRFCDTDGRLMEMQVLPMGHTASPELMQILASVLSGHPRYCNPEHSFDCPSRRVLIDNIRLCGSLPQMREAANWLDATASALHVTWNADEMRDAARRYDFLGGDWDHTDGTIRISAKHKERFKGVPSSLSFTDAETLVGRLVHFSGMLQLITGRYYWAMKWFRRQANLFNRGLIDSCEQLILSQSVRANLHAWMQDCGQPYTVPKRLGVQREASLFTDASLQGWGAILVTPDSRVHASGGQWVKTYESGDICTLEGVALAEAIECFYKEILRCGASTLHVFVDNTSVKAAVAKGRLRK